MSAQLFLALAKAFICKQQKETMAKSGRKRTVDEKDVGHSLNQEFYTQEQHPEPRR